MAPDDVEAVAVLDCRLVSDAPMGIERVRMYDGRDGRRRGMVAVHQGAIVGYCLYANHRSGERWYMHLARLGVTQRHRRRRVAASMINWLVCWCRQVRQDIYCEVRAEQASLMCFLRDFGFVATYGLQRYDQDDEIREWYIFHRPVDSRLTFRLRGSQIRL
jgi:GNAT superfamily N-acetyltransferase